VSALLLLSFNQLRIMKKQTLLILVWLVALTAYSQENFPLVWKVKFAFNPYVYNFRNPQGTLFFGANNKTVQMLDENGKELWSEKSDKYGLKEIDLVTWIKDAHVIRLGIKSSKNQTPLSVFVDARTGQELWRTEKITWMGFDGATIDESYISELNAIYAQYGWEMVMIELKTGKEIWNINTYKNLKLESLECFHPDGMDIIEVVIDGITRSYYELKTGAPVSKITSKYFTQQSSHLGSLIVPDEDIHLRLDYKRKLMRGSTGTSTPMLLSAKKFSNGEPLWQVKFDANLVTTLVTQRDMLKFFVSDRRVFVVYEGISVFDLKTGKELWKSDFNNSEVSIGLKAKQELGLADLPLVNGNEVYIADLTKNCYGVRKVNASSGKTLWQTEKYKSEDIIPALHLKNNVLLAQFGGVINIQTYIETDKSIRTTSKWKFRGIADIKAFDPATGKLLWDGKSLGLKMDFISSFQFDNEHVFFFTDKEFIAVDIAIGQVKTRIDLKDARLGEPLMVKIEAGKAYAIMDKGFCGLDLNTESILFVSKVKEVTGYFEKGGRCFLLTGDEQEHFVGINLESGKILGKLEGSEDNVTVDGKFVIDMRKENVVKYSVN